MAKGKKNRKAIFDRILKRAEKEQREEGKNVLNSAEYRDELIDEYVNQPMTKRGHENVGAGLSTILSLLGDSLPSSADSETADAALPGAGMIRRGSKALKKTRKDILDEIEIPETVRKKKPKPSSSTEPPTLNYLNMEVDDMNKIKRAQKKADEEAYTLSYNPDGSISKRAPKKKPTK